MVMRRRISIKAALFALPWHPTHQTTLLQGGQGPVDRVQGDGRRLGPHPPPDHLGRGMVLGCDHGSVHEIALVGELEPVRGKEGFHGFGCHKNYS